jgi:acyl dehydratase
MKKDYTLTEFRQLVGQEVAVSDWIDMPQERINLFADATGDHQWIHVDPERARRESPFHSTIAHGFLTLSLLPMMMGTLCTPTDARATLNYGLNKVRFPAPVPSGSRVRGRIKLLTIEDLPDCAQVTWQVTVEREGGEKPVCIAESIMRNYPK